MEGGEFHLKAPMPGLVVAVLDGRRSGSEKRTGHADPRIHEDAERTQSSA